ncbi:MAG: hypothetical protein AAGL66_13705 [Pseudomonadota bacterium]
MDKSILSIIAIASLLFFAVLIWKGMWLLRKMREEPPEADADEQAPKDPPDLRSNSD